MCLRKTKYRRQRCLSSLKNEFKTPFFILQKRKIKGEVTMKNFMRKAFSIITVSAITLSLAACGGNGSESNSSSSSGDTVKVGILHSMTGTMAMSEMPLVDAVEMAIDEINENGGVLGKQIEYVLEDGASDSAIFAEKATKLLTSDNVATVFGCWTSASRKAVLPVFEGNNGLLWYPVQYEGLESSHNIMYTSCPPNQQAIPAVDYLYENNKGDDDKLQLFLLGSDYVYPRTTNTIIKAIAEEKGIEIVGEEYLPLGHTDMSTVLTKIQQTKPDAIINTINGDSNVAFFKQFKDAGLTAEDIPIMSFSCYEEDIKGMGPEYAEGHLFAWNYFQTVDTPESIAFTEKYKKLYGEDRVTGDPIQDAYIGVYLWAAACEKAGSFDVDKVIEACESGEIEYMAPEGLVTIDPETHHLYKVARIGKANAEGQIEELWSTEDRIKPDPWLTEYSWAADAGLGK